nr:MAG TPA: hypothetical protein [Bacteriophage sp.]
MRLTITERKFKERMKRNDCNKNHYNCIAIFAFCNVYIKLH